MVGTLAASLVAIPCLCSLCLPYTARLRQLLDIRIHAILAGCSLARLAYRCLTMALSAPKSDTAPPNL